MSDVIKVTVTEATPIDVTITSAQGATGPAGPAGAAGDPSTPWSFTQLGTVDGAVGLDMLNKAQLHGVLTLGPNATTFTLANVPTGDIGVVLHVKTVTDLPALTFTNCTSPPDHTLPTLANNEVYKYIITRNPHGVSPDLYTVKGERQR